VGGFDSSRKVESLYLTPDVLAQRCKALKALKLTGGERVLDIGSSPRQSWSTNRLTMVRLKGG
jgi:hypothetical protein